MVSAATNLRVSAGYAVEASPGDGGNAEQFGPDENSVKVEQVEVLGAKGEINPVSTAVKCVMNLTVQYMGIYTAIALLRVAADFMGENSKSWTLGESLEQATLTVNYAPMLSILFLAVRMRVLWLTRLQGNPPLWIQKWMYGATYAVLAMTLVALIVPLLTGEKVKICRETGKPDEEHQPFKNTIAAVCFTILKYLIMIGIYVGAVSIIYGTYTYKPPAGAWPGDKIPPVSPAVECTMILTSMYFIVYAGIQAGKTLQSFSGIDSSKLTGALQGAICTMFFAPMMAVLFIGARMRAMQMDPINVPIQKWAQNCFYMCTYAVMFQCILAILVPLVLGGEVQSKNTKGDVEYVVNNSCIG